MARANIQVVFEPEYRIAAYKWANFLLQETQVPYSKDPPNILAYSSDEVISEVCAYDVQSWVSKV